jgi:hypothetical protein
MSRVIHVFRVSFLNRHVTVYYTPPCPQSPCPPCAMENTLAYLDPEFERLHSWTLSEYIRRPETAQLKRHKTELERACLADSIRCSEANQAVPRSAVHYKELGGVSPHFRIKVTALIKLVELLRDSIEPHVMEQRMAELHQLRKNCGTTMINIS